MPSSERNHSRRTVRQFAIASMSVGACFLAFSFLPAFASGKVAWSTEKAVEYQRVSLEIQELTHELIAKPPGEMSRETSERAREAFDNFESLRSELQNAQGKSGLVAAMLRIGGVALILAGVVAFLATLQRSPHMRAVHLHASDAANESREMAG